jgi:hypothetical protein
VIQSLLWQVREAEFVSLNRPGGNVSGVSSLDVEPRPETAEAKDTLGPTATVRQHASRTSTILTILMSNLYVQSFFGAISCIYVFNT